MRLLKRIRELEQEILTLKNQVAVLVAKDTERNQKMKENAIKAENAYNWLTQDERPQV